RETTGGGDLSDLPLPLVRRVLAFVLDGETWGLAAYRTEWLPANRSNVLECVPWALLQVSKSWREMLLDIQGEDDQLTYSIWLQL
uniref:Uncharacterized protein n=1 Tax=Globisporangium ultimum (strain ATCC 200006 / CBS 805.95 / DAOM BR144) TaxID=431595 RepID=K3WM70_GLOUD